MQLNIDGHHLQVSDALREYVLTKLKRVERHSEHITNAHFVLSVDRTTQRAEGNIHVSGADVFAQADSEDMYAAIDSLMDKLDRQVVKHRERILSRHRTADNVPLQDEPQ